MHNDALIGSLIGLAILLIVFLVCREIVCWYWKVNRIVELLEEQNKLLRAKLGEREEDRLK